MVRSNYIFTYGHNDSCYLIISQRVKGMGFSDNEVELNVVSLIIAALIIRVIYVSMETLKILVEDVVTSDCVDPYRRSYYYIPNWILTSLFFLFSGILIYRWYADSKPL